MENTLRLFNCARCHRQVQICQHCDRGNIYCNSNCSKISRISSLRDASKRYQKTRQGRFKHAARQKRYRDKIKSVTYHGSHEPSNNDLILEMDKPVEFTPKKQCDFCGKTGSNFIRLDFLKRYSRDDADFLFKRSGDP